jgi:hypothetical protein
VLPPDRGRRQLGHILRELATAKASGAYPLENVITQLSVNFGRGMTIAAITPSVNTAWMAAMLSMTRRGLSPAAIVLDSESFGGKPGAQAVVDDLANLGIPAFLIRQGQGFNTVARTVPLQEKKIYRVLGTGRVITQDAPAATISGMSVGRDELVR